VVTIDLGAAEEVCTEPGALVQVKRAYARLTSGERLEVRSPIAEHAFAVRAWARRSGIQVVADDRVDGVTSLVLATGPEDGGQGTPPPG